MKTLYYYLFILPLCFACNSDNEITAERDYRQDMRDLVIRISSEAKAGNETFLIIPQNGIELVVNNEEDLIPDTAYLNAIDGHGQEDLFYGYDFDDVPTPFEATNYLTTFLISKASGNIILVTDYCSTPSNISNSYEANSAKGYVSYAAQERALNIIPAEAPIYENNNDIGSLTMAQNFLYLINPELYSSKEEYISAVAATNYDLLIIDLFFNNEILTVQDVTQLKYKANGGQRLVVCYMSIGEAEDYRYYWENNWTISKPSWIAAENPDWPGNYKVNYWNDEWQSILYKNEDSYLKKITATGFDGVYLDIIDAFEYFENN